MPRRTTANSAIQRGWGCLLVFGLFRQTAVSRRVGVVETAFTVSGESEAGLQILGGKIGKVGEDFLFGHAAGEIVEDIVNRDTKPSDARFAAALVGFDRDDVLVVHERESARGREDRQGRARGEASRRNHFSVQC